jgi:hypothetical protein
VPWKGKAVNPRANWFIHPASPNSIWIWNGKDELLLIQVTDMGDSL